MGDDQGAGVNEWVNVVRRARLHPHTKLVALLMASYADPDGTNIYPGVALLAVQGDLGYRTVQRELGHLRAMGLVEQGSRQGLRKGWSVPYRLILGEDLIDKVDVPTPAAEKLAAEKLAEAYRGRHRKSARHPDGVTSAHGPVDNSPPEGITSRHSDGVQTDDLTPGDDTTSRQPQPGEQPQRPPPSIDLSLVTNPPYAQADHRYPGTGSARAPASDDEDFEARRRRAQDELAEWMRQHPEVDGGTAVAAITTGVALRHAANGTEL